MNSGLGAKQSVTRKASAVSDEVASDYLWKSKKRGTITSPLSSDRRFLAQLCCVKGIDLFRLPLTICSGNSLAPCKVGDSRQILSADDLLKNMHPESSQGYADSILKKSRAQDRNRRCKRS